MLVEEVSDTSQYINTVGLLYYKPLKCGNLYNKDIILCPSVVLKCIK